mgnify:CR=1 FL=1
MIERRPVVPVALVGKLQQEVHQPPDAVLVLVVVSFRRPARVALVSGVLLVGMGWMIGLMGVAMTR